MNFLVNFPLAFAILSSPQDAPIPDDFNLPLIQEIAIKLELVDEKEAEQIFTEYGSLSQRGKLCELRRRFHLLKDAPPSADEFRLPPYRLVEINYRMALKYKENMEEMLAFAPYRQVPYYEGCIGDASQLVSFWNEAFDTTAAYTRYNWQKRLCLKKLRNMMGYENYYASRYPPPVPVWRFVSR